MSNALSARGALPAGDAAGAWGCLATATKAEKAHVAVLTIGVVLLLIWIARRAIHPKRLRLSPSPGRPNTVTPVHVILLLLGWMFVMAGVRQLLPHIAHWASKAQMGLLAGLAGQVCWLAASLLVAARTFPLGLSRGLGLSTRHWLYDGVRAVVACLAIRPVCFGLSKLFIWLLEPHGLVRVHGMVEAMQSAPGVLWRVLIVFSAVVMAPLAEEVFFRGLLQSMLRTRTGRPWLAVTVTSAAFAAVHWNTPQDIPALFALSLVLGYNYERTGRLAPVIAIHVLFNAISIVWILVAVG